MGMARSILDTAQAILESGSADARRPVLKRHNESNVKDLFIIGDLAGAPVIKLAMEQGYNVVEHIASLPDAAGNADRHGEDVYDVAICGAGASGLNAALHARDKGLSAVVLEKGKIANTIEDFPEGKWIYAEPDEVPPKGKLWLDGATKEDLTARWKQIVSENELDVRTEHGVTGMRREGQVFTVLTDGAQQQFRARRVIIAIGQRGNPRKLGVPGEQREEVYHRLYSPRLYEKENILVVGGGNSAVEAALALSENNTVTISYRGDQFGRVFRDNERKLNEAVAAGRIKVILQSNVTEFSHGQALLSVVRAGKSGEAETVTIPYDHAFVLVGAELPVRFLNSVGIELENTWKGRPALAAGLTLLPYLLILCLTQFGGYSAWTGWGSLLIPAVVLIYRGSRKNDKYAWLGFSFLVVFSLYGVSKAIWPYPMLLGQPGSDYLVFKLYHGADENLSRMLNRGGPFWYTVLYCLVMTVFGIRAMKRWGFERNDKFQIMRYCCLILAQWILFFILPEFIWQGFARWTGMAEASQRGYLAYGLAYPWPLYLESFNKGWGSTPDAQSFFWVAYGLVLAFVITPIFVLFQGKRFCSWICGCGGLAETLGDRWRHLAPKGKASIKWESMAWVIIAVAVVVTVMIFPYDALRLKQSYAVGDRANIATSWYKLMVDGWMAGILPVTLYPFLGGKVWCRYWCPLAKLMQLGSKIFTKLGVGRFAIGANSKCIACGECTRYCQVGIPVMQYALKQDTLDNQTSSCIGCGICVTVCPMDVLGMKR